MNPAVLLTLLGITHLVPPAEAFNWAGVINNGGQGLSFGLMGSGTGFLAAAGATSHRSHMEELDTELTILTAKIKNEQKKIALTALDQAEKAHNSPSQDLPLEDEHGGTRISKSNPASPVLENNVVSTNLTEPVLENNVSSTNLTSVIQDSNEASPTPSIPLNVTNNNNTSAQSPSKPPSKNRPSWSRTPRPAPLHHLPAQADVPIHISAAA
ncbi:hypothetical protein BJ684DRAFT_19587 [Piptocephalis cylindrospora]|uniref:Uncharacterized protein n=1 Tax=Piptocephalis cylindrospora TaxID=1907219 RepID=A0A4P9Y4Y1_9FUNG|nr:hypothetical protein BJ684DRAFT_19587 [Piptocephalis cylindrospora]|eukprot:RKP13975.1 hypothetical protein BJ684DRAFT_19587 [Piptocephalis cylindrospora]